MEIPSKKQVKKAGDTLVKNPKDAKAMEILSQWRSLHAHPVNTFQALLRKKALKIKDAVIAQRLKRTPSIIRKLQRFPNMDLSRMQDIGGVRIIVPKIADVYELHQSLITGRHQHKPVLPPKDYIKNPKEDGYRSLHQVFKYASINKPELNGLQIELQIRTHLQHYWATAVETLGIIEKSSFKTGEGNEEFKHFFKLVSVLFAHSEKKTVLDRYRDTPIKDIISEIVTLERKLQIFTKLKGLIITGKHITATQPKGVYYYLMQLDTSSDTATLSLIPFSEEQLPFAEKTYRLLEIDNIDNPSIELVLMSVNSFKDVKKAYPNYFLDTQKFIDHLQRLIAKSA
ncbi:RelA/SpoT domain-containing protein [Pelistega sp. MC2]|uniref:RelA/SpoT domain-containing protein n=1 Tax=Pelistega sp. MC2 TaxID=1720297 RepID=UPI0008DA1BB1|nr:RelA/SpoT domain-containing protein [Pelistega sp. MC2]